MDDMGDKKTAEHVTYRGKKWSQTAQFFIAGKKEHGNSRKENMADDHKFQKIPEQGFAYRQKGEEEIKWIQHTRMERWKKRHAAKGKGIPVRKLKIDEIISYKYPVWEFLLDKIFPEMTRSKDNLAVKNQAEKKNSVYIIIGLFP